jgi:hypothetical protein
MRQFFHSRRWILFFSSLMLIAFVVLAGELKTAAFRPAQPLGRAESESIQFSVSKVMQQITEVPFWKQVIFWLTLFLIVLLVSSLLSPELRKRLILSFVRLAAFTLLLLYLIKHNPGLLEGLLPGGPHKGGEASTSMGLDIPPPIFEPPQISSVLSYFITFGIILLFLALLWGLSRWWRLQHMRPGAGQPLEEIAAAARSSLQDLYSGSDFEDAIITCYARMNRVVEARRGLYRDLAMTPAEFAARLEAAGLPREAVHRLTRLFESVRYGARRPGRGEIDEAAACLTSIVQYCGEAG